VWYRPGTNGTEDKSIAIFYCSIFFFAHFCFILLIAKCPMEPNENIALIQTANKTIETYSKPAVSYIC
jgi:hypothetical protein